MRTREDEPSLILHVEQNALTIEYIANWIQTSDQYAPWGKSVNRTCTAGTDVRTGHNQHGIVFPGLKWRIFVQDGPGVGLLVQWERKKQDREYSCHYARAVSRGNKRCGDAIQRRYTDAMEALYLNVGVVRALWLVLIWSVPGVTYDESRPSMTQPTRRRQQGSGKV
jgi:hypothetical protein